MSIREKLEDTGKKLIGRGAEVAFKNDAENYASTHGLPVWQAEKAVLLNIGRALQSEISSQGTVDLDSKNFRNFQAGLRQIADGQNMAELFKINKIDAKFRTIPPPTISRSDEFNAENYYRRKFNGKSPNHAIVIESVRTAKNIDQLLARFSSDPRVIGHKGKLDSLILASAPELGADIQKLFSEKRRLEKIERHFGRELVHEKQMDNFKKTVRESIANMLWTAPANFIKDVFRADRSSGDFGSQLLKFTGRFMFASGKFALREGWEGAKLAGSAAKTLAAYLNKELR